MPQSHESPSVLKLSAKFMNLNSLTWAVVRIRPPSRRCVRGRVRGQNTHRDLCDQNRGDGGYENCYGLALQAPLRRVGADFVVEVFLRSHLAPKLDHCPVTRAMKETLHDAVIREQASESLSGNNALMDCSCRMSTARPLSAQLRNLAWRGRS